MQKQILYKYSDTQISNYQQEDVAIYDFELTDSDIKQIKKLTQDSLTFSIPQLNINYCNNFNENYDITIQYAPIIIYDMNQFIIGSDTTIRGNEGFYKNIMINNNDDGVFTYQPYQDPSVDQRDVQEINPVKTTPYSNLRFNQDYQGTQIQPKAHTFSLQQQSINSLLNELNYPLKHIPYGQDENNPVYHIIKQSDGNYYKTQVVGEIDISNQIYWDTYNGKLRFNYKGTVIDTSKWIPLALGEWVNSSGNSTGGTGGYHIITHQGIKYGNLGYWPQFGFNITGHQNLDGTIFTYNDGGTFTYNYSPSILDTYDLMNNIQKASEQTIYVKSLDSFQENKMFYVNNLYFANQLLGLMQRPQRILSFLEEYQQAGYSLNVYPQTEKNNYHLNLWMNDNQNKYLKNICADFYFDAINPDDGFTDQFMNRSSCLSKEFFLQIWREVYVMTPTLQSNTLLYKPENIKYTKYLQYTNTNNANGKDWINPEKSDTPYIFTDKLSTIAYYVNSVSFNNYVSLQNNYPLQYNQSQQFEIEIMKNMRFILLDENGVILPRLSEFKVYLQFDQNMNNETQSNTTNFNRVISD